MTPQVRFSVVKVFDLPQRGGLLAVGTVLAGTVSQGMMLQSEETGARTTVLGIEMVAPPGRPSGQVTLILERTVPSPVLPGQLLTGVARNSRDNEAGRPGAGRASSKVVGRSERRLDPGAARTVFAAIGDLQLVTSDVTFRSEIEVRRGSSLCVLLTGRGERWATLIRERAFRGRVGVSATF